jgi:tetratricopeptide (TPR) repeat protein
VNPPPGKKGQQAGFTPVATEPADQLVRVAVGLENTPEGRPAYRIALTLLLDTKQIAACQATTLGDIEKRAVELYNAGRYAEALDGYREAIRTGKEPTWAYRGVADCLGNLDRRKEAAEAYRNAAKAAPDDIETLYWYANSQIGENDKDAVGHFKKLMAREPSNARGAIGLANALYNLDRFTEAIRAFDQAKRLCPHCLNDNDRSVYADAKRMNSP